MPRPFAHSWRLYARLLVIVCCGLSLYASDVQPRQPPTAEVPAAPLVAVSPTFCRVELATGATDCRTCHDAPHHPAFDHATALEKILHGK